MKSVVNVVDVEATCWNGDDPAGQVTEIIEIGLVVVDLATHQRLDRHRILVRPALSTVSAFCTDLTGLTPEDVEDGLSFAEACDLLASEHEARSRPWVSWGDYDRHQFTRQCERDDVAYPFGPAHTNAKAVFAAARGLNRGVGMDKALRLVGLPLEGRHHRGDDDAWNIAALILHLHETGDWPEPRREPTFA